jgi:Spy/CpxP family protein refolding chaperone
MNGRILALGAMLVLTASAVDAQATRRGKDKATADSSIRGRTEDHRAKRGRGHDDDKRGKDDDGRRGAMNGRGYGMLLNGIELTDAQKTRIQAIREQYRPRFAAIRDTAIALRKDNVKTAADSTIRVKHQTLVKSERAEVRAVLTTAQQTRFDANVQRMEERMAKREKGFGRDRDKRGDSRR